MPSRCQSSAQHADYQTSHIAVLLEKYANIKATMSLPDSATSGAFDYINGLRQGDPESSPAFDEVMEFILEPLHNKWSQERLAFQLPETGHFISRTRIADNMYLFAKGSAEALTMLEDLLFALWSHGLEINDKSKQFMAAGSLKGVQLTLYPFG